MLLKKSKYFYIPPQLVANKKALKGQDIWKFLKDFYNTPHLYKGIHKVIYAQEL